MPLFSMSDSLNDPFGFDEGSSDNSMMNRQTVYSTQVQTMPMNPPPPLQPGVKRYMIVNGTRTEVDSSNKPIGVTTTTVTNTSITSAGSSGRGSNRMPPMQTNYVSTTHTERVTAPAQFQSQPPQVIPVPIVVSNQNGQANMGPPPGVGPQGYGPPHRLTGSPGRPSGGNSNFQPPQQGMGGQNYLPTITEERPSQPKADDTFMQDLNRSLEEVPLEVLLTRNLGDRQPEDPMLKGNRGGMQVIPGYSGTKKSAVEDVIDARMKDAKQAINRGLNEFGDKVGIHPSPGQGFGDAVTEAGRNLRDSARQGQRSLRDRSPPIAPAVGVPSAGQMQVLGQNRGYNMSAYQPQQTMTQQGFSGTMSPYQSSMSQQPYPGAMMGPPGARFNAVGANFASRINMMAQQYGLDINDGGVLLVATTVLTLMFLIVVWQLFRR